MACGLRERTAGAARSSGQVSGRGPRRSRELVGRWARAARGAWPGAHPRSAVLGRVRGGVRAAGRGRTGGDNGLAAEPLLPEGAGRSGAGPRGAVPGGLVTQLSVEDFPCDPGRREADGRTWKVSSFEKVRLGSRGVRGGIVCCVRPVLSSDSQRVFFFDCLLCFRFFGFCLLRKRRV